MTCGKCSGPLGVKNSTGFCGACTPVAYECSIGGCTARISATNRARICAEHRPITRRRAANERRYRRAGAHVVLPIRLSARAPERETRHQRAAVKRAFSASRRPAPVLPVAVCVTRVGPKLVAVRRLERWATDIRAAVALWLGTTPTDPRIEWSHRQATGGEYAVRVAVEPVGVRVGGAA